MIEFASRALIAAGSAALLFGAWQWREHVLLERGRTQGAAPYVKAGAEAQAANKATGQARAQLDARGEFRYLEAMQAKEHADAARKSADDRNRRLAGQLRDDLAAARRAAAERPTDAGGADPARLARCEQLLDESHGLVVDLAERAGEGGSLVSEGAGLLDEYRIRLERARDWGQAATLNAPPTPPPD